MSRISWRCGFFVYLRSRYGKRTVSNKRTAAHGPERAEALQGDHLLVTGTGAWVYPDACPRDYSGYFLTLFRYIHQNPVKAGLVKTAKDYSRIPTPH